MGVRSSRVEESRYRCVRTGLGPADGEGAGDRPVPVRLRCVEDGVDCCEVSKRFGGGGHAGAAGFVLDVTDIRFREFIEKHKLISQ